MPLTEAQQHAADLVATPEGIFAQLPPGQRRVCEKLVDRHCYKYVDVATVLQISTGTVRRHLD